MTPSTHLVLLLLVAATWPAAGACTTAAAPDPGGDASDTDTEVVSDAPVDVESGPDVEVADAPDGDARGDLGSDLPAAPPCPSDEACDDGDTCTVDHCDAGTGACAHQPLACAVPPTPCLASSCDPALGCALTLAAPGAGGCCFEEPLLGSWDFEGPALPTGSEVVDLGPGGGEPVGWQPSDLRALTGTQSLWFGREGAADFDNGQAVAGRLTLPPAQLPSDARAELTFHVWADVEPGDAWDLLQAHVQVDGEEPVPVWTKGWGGVAPRRWVAITVDLGAFAGSTVRVAFTFDSVDDTFNDGEGLYLDAIWLWQGCAGLGCAGAADCDDGIPCTADACGEGGQCLYVAAAPPACCELDAECDDGDHCTADLCVGLACQHPALADLDCCNSAADCDDGNPCTTDACAPGAAWACQHSLLFAPGCCSEAVECDDGDPCTSDLCDAFQCAHSATCCETDAECDDGDDVCTQEACVAGLCATTPSGAAGCCDARPWSEDFDGPPGPWTFSGGGAGCQWQILPAAAGHLTSGALYYGDPEQQDFDCGVTAGAASSGPLALQPGVDYLLSFWLWMDTEPGPDFDVITVSAIGTLGQAWPLWGKPDIAPRSWTPVTVHLGAFAGLVVRIEITFKTGDGIGNDGEGVYVDELAITSSCLPRPCADVADCADGHGHTLDVCVGGLCAWELP